MKKKVMIFTGYYIPGVKGGGPIQSIKNLIDNLADVFDFYVVTLDRDLGDTVPYKDVNINEWNQLESAKVYYIGNDKISFKNTRQIIKSISPETIYLNSFFSFDFSIIPVILNKLNLINPHKLVIAPRGEFSNGALNLKTSKKKTYINLVNKIRVYNKKNVYWHMTSKFEEEDFYKNLNVEKNVYICQNFSANYVKKTYNKKNNKNQDELRLISLARIHPMKNLNYGIELLHGFEQGNITFDIYGPIEDEDYWEKCKKNISLLPSNVKVEYNGLLNHGDVLKTFEKYHFFLFPTHGENFGHVISESLISGTPVITSDQTPWKDLCDKQIGWDINLSNPEKFINAIQIALELNQKEYLEVSKKAFDYGKRNSQQEDKKEKMSKILG